MSALLELMLISVGLSLAMAIPYRLLTKPEQIRRAKAEAATYKKQMGEARKRGDMPETNRLMQEMLKANQVQMKQNFKPMLPSLIIFFIAVSTLHSYGPIATSNQTQTGLYFGSPLNMSAKLQGDTLLIDQDGNGEFETSLKNREAFVRGEYFWQANLEGTPKLEAQIAHSPVLVPLLQFGFPPIYLSHYLSWFWIYFLLVIPTTILFRKLLGAE